MTMKCTGLARSLLRDKYDVTYPVAAVSCFISRIMLASDVKEIGFSVGELEGALLQNRERYFDLTSVESTQ